MTEATNQVKFKNSVYLKLKDSPGKTFNDKVELLLGIKKKSEDTLSNHEERIKKLERELDKARGY